MRFTVKFGTVSKCALHNRHRFAKLVVWDNAISIIQVVTAFVHVGVLLDKVEHMGGLLALMHLLERLVALDHLAKRRGIFTTHVLTIHVH